jgi:hypothetical protein
MSDSNLAVGGGNGGNTRTWWAGLETWEKVGVGAVAGCAMIAGVVLLAPVAGAVASAIAAEGALVGFSWTTAAGTLATTAAIGKAAAGS